MWHFDNLSTKFFLSNSKLFSLRAIFWAKIVVILWICSVFLKSPQNYGYFLSWTQSSIVVIESLNFMKRLNHDVYCACVRFDEISGQDKELKTSKGISIEKPKINLAWSQVQEVFDMFKNHCINTKISRNTRLDLTISLHPYFTNTV